MKPAIALQPEDPPRAKRLRPTVYLTQELEDMLAHAARLCGVWTDEVRLPSGAPGAKRQSLADARHAFWWAARARNGCSFPELGGMFGRDHTTAMSAWKKVNAAVRAGTRLGQIALAVASSEQGSLDGFQGVQDQLRELQEGCTAKGATSGPSSSSASNDPSEGP